MILAVTPEIRFDGERIGQLKGGECDLGHVEQEGRILVVRKFRWAARPNPFSGQATPPLPSLHPANRFDQEMVLPLPK
jgi:hypothetical protein